MRTVEDAYSFVDRLIFDQGRDTGIDVARAPGYVWVRGEDDEAETIADFLVRARREAREAGLSVIEVSGYIGTRAKLECAFSPRPTGSPSSGGKINAA